MDNLESFKQEERMKETLSRFKQNNVDNMKYDVLIIGGINAALCNAPDGKDDTWGKHAFDTVKGSDFLVDQKAV